MNSFNARRTNLPPVSGRVTVSRLGLPRALDPKMPAGSCTDAVELHYVFDFSAFESVIYTGPGVFPGRVFLLRFWRHAKDGLMSLLGYKHQGHWRDPTRCYPNSYVRYFKPLHAQHPVPHRAGEPQDTTGGPGHEERQDTTGGHRHHEEPQDTTQQRQRPGIDQLAYRVPMLELEPGVYELPTLSGKPVHMLEIAQTFPRLIKKDGAAIAPPLNVPTQKVILFAGASAHFDRQAQAEHELSGVVKVLQQFPLLRVTIQGNFAKRITSEKLRGFGPGARADQNALLPYPLRRRWPTGVEEYHSIGEVMDSRAQTIRQYLLRNRIAPQRVITRRGQYTERATITLIFSN